MPLGRGGVRAQRRRVCMPTSCAGAPPLCRAATSPPACGGRKFSEPAFLPLGGSCGWLQFSFLPPLGGRCRQAEGGTRAAPAGAHTVLVRAGVPPSVALRHLPPQAGGENFPNPLFSPPWGGDAFRQRGGARAAPAGVHALSCAWAFPPLSRCDISPRKRGEKNACVATFFLVGLAPISPPLGGEMPLGRGGVRAPRRRVCMPSSCARAPPLCRAATSPPASGGRKFRTLQFLPPLGGRCR